MEFTYPKELYLKLKKGLKVVTWFTAYKNRSFLFSHNETYHKSLLKEPNNEWENKILSIEDEKKLDDYISSRKLGHKIGYTFIIKIQNLVLM